MRKEEKRFQERDYARTFMKSKKIDKKEIGKNKKVQVQGLPLSHGCFFMDCGDAKY